MTLRLVGPRVLRVHWQRGPASYDVVLERLTGGRWTAGPHAEVLTHVWTVQVTAGTWRVLVTPDGGQPWTTQSVTVR